MINKIIFKFCKYTLACVTTMFLWNFAGQAMTEKDDIANIYGIGLYVAIVALWIWLIGRQQHLG